MVTAVPVTVVASGGLPVTNLKAHGATPYTVVTTPSALPVTLVAPGVAGVQGATPVTLLNPDGSLYLLGVFAAEEVRESPPPPPPAQPLPPAEPGPHRQRSSHRNARGTSAKGR
jgi:hypothetical protein